MNEMISKSTICASNRIILDNGSGMIKAGFANQNKPKVVIPNCIGQLRKKTNVIVYAENVYTLPDYFCHRPQKHGLLVDIDMQRDIWQYIFNKSYYSGWFGAEKFGGSDRTLGGNATSGGSAGGLNISHFNEYSLCVTEPFLNLPALRYSLSEIAFEDFGFNEFLVMPTLHITPFAFFDQFYYDSYEDFFNLSRFPCNLNNKLYMNDEHLDTNRKGEGGRGCIGGKSKGGLFGTKINRDDGGILCYEGEGLEVESSRQQKDLYFNSNSFNHEKEVEIQSNLLYMPNSLSYSSICFPYSSTADTINDRKKKKEKKNTTRTFVGNFKAPAEKLNEGAVVRNPFSLVVDCGFSYCSTMPFYEFSPIDYGALRTDVGGAHLNAYMKQLLNFRHINVEQNELLVQHIKEESCYVALDFIKELKEFEKIKSKNVLLKSQLERNNNALAYEYELPDYNVKNKSLLFHFFSTNRSILFKGAFNSSAPSTTDKNIRFEAEKEGGAVHTPQVRATNSDSSSPQHLYSSCKEENLCTDFSVPDIENIKGVGNLERENEKIILCNERISVPEILFYPKDIDLNECGVSELIYRSIMKLPFEYRSFFVQQILLVGGSSKFKGFKERLYKQLRMIFPQNWKICIYQEADPSLSVWRGMKNFSSNDYLYEANKITKAQYLEEGSLHNQK